MSGDELERERRESAEALRRVSEQATAEADAARTSEAVLGTPPQVTLRETSAEAGAVEAPIWNPPTPPDLTAVNGSWPAPVARKAGPLGSLLESARAEDHAAQVRFNSDQVRLDNALVEWVSAHFAATHTHYDSVIASLQKRLDEVDTRHRELERELVRHVHEMARRIDVVLGEGEKGRVAHEAALRSVRERLRRLEEALRPPDARG